MNFDFIYRSLRTGFYAILLTTTTVVFYSMYLILTLDENDGLILPSTPLEAMITPFTYIETDSAGQPAIPMTFNIVKVSPYHGPVVIPGLATYFADGPARERLVFMKAGPGLIYEVSPFWYGSLWAVLSTYILRIWSFKIALLGALGFGVVYPLLPTLILWVTKIIGLNLTPPRSSNQ